MTPETQAHVRQIAAVVTSKPPATPTLMFTLPYPPSMNHLWRRVGDHTRLSAGARRYRKAVADTVFAARAAGGPLAVATTGRCLPLAGRLGVTLTLVPPTAARRDLDNHIKAVQDALTQAGLWRDDAQIDDLRVLRAAPDWKRPRMEVVVTVLAGAS